MQFEDEAMAEKVAKVIIDTLQAAGVRHCYGIVGDTLNLIASYIDQDRKSVV